MNSDFVDKDSLLFPQGKPTLSAESGAELKDGAFIIITQAFCPKGHSLLDTDGPLFDGFPGITLHVQGEDATGTITISPMHGDDRREGVDVVDGSQYKLTCPECGEELPVFAPCDCAQGGQLRSIELVPGGIGETAAICDVAGCRRSRIAQGLDILAVFDEDEPTI